MKVLINYADDKYRKYQKYNSKTGLSKGGFDKVIEYSPKDIDQEYYDNNKSIFDIKRGAGLWLWKPYVILKALNSLNEGDYIFYADSGSYFINKIDHLIHRLEKDDIDIMTFDTPLLNIQFAKAEFINQLGPGLENWLYSTQIMGGFILIRNTKNTRRLMEEFLSLCEKKDLIAHSTDEPQHAQFVAHREDQTILSYLAWKKGLKPYRDPTQYGRMPLDQVKYGIDKIGLSYVCFKKYDNSDYPDILVLYRKKKLYNLFPRIRFQFILFIKQMLLKKLVPV